MAVYKVIQDVEAEDKLIGFLTLKGFIYAAIAATSAFIEVRMVLAGSLGPARYIVMLVFLGPMILFGVLASPLGREQPTEVWLLSRIKFFFKPRIRTWDQSGAKNLVTVTAPKKAVVQLTKNLSQGEVKSRLSALATTLDSRGWAVKSAAVDAAAVPTYLQNDLNDPDRLANATVTTASEPVLDLHEADDIMDEQNNPTAQKFASMMQQADDKRKQEITERINQARQVAGDTTFLDQQAPKTNQTMFVGKNVVAPGQDASDTKAAAVTNAEQQLLERKHQEQAEIERKMPKNFLADKAAAKKTLLTPGKPAAAPTPTPQVTPQAQAAKLELAQSGNDLSVASIASLANRVNVVQQVGPNEFEIDLH